jgi:Protein of unknown function (DUF4242)
MKLFMDVHSLAGVTVDAVAAAHAEDLKVQHKHGVEFIRYWVDEQAGKVFCLMRAADANAPVAAHREAHGLVPDEIYEVTEGD